MKLEILQKGWAEISGREYSEEMVGNKEFTMICCCEEPVTKQNQKEQTNPAVEFFMEKPKNERSAAQTIITLPILLSWCLEN